MNSRPVSPEQGSGSFGQNRPFSVEPAKDGFVPASDLQRCVRQISHKGNGPTRYNIDMIANGFASLARSNGKPPNERENGQPALGALQHRAGFAMRRDKLDSEMRLVAEI